MITTFIFITSTTQAEKWRGAGEEKLFQKRIIKSALKP